jgi:hypothetical protein
MTVLVIGRRHHRRRRADVQDEGDAGLAQPAPHRIQVGMARRAFAGCRGRQPDGAASEFDGEIDFLEGSRGIVERRDTHADQASIPGAEVGHGAVQGSCPAIFHVVVRRGQELRAGEGGEYQLAGKSKIVERL